jgi:hypothetical protein
LQPVLPGPTVISRNVSRITVLLLFLVACGSRAAAAPFTFTFGTLPPSGLLAAVPGELVGWGYAIANEDPDRWLELVALDADPFAHAAPGFPTLVFDFPVLAPGTTRTVAWAPGSAGLFEFAFALGTPAGTTNAGQFLATETCW